MSQAGFLVCNPGLTTPAAQRPHITGDARDGPGKQRGAVQNASAVTKGDKNQHLKAFSPPYWEGCAHACLCACMHLCVHVHVYACAYTCVYACVRLHICTYVLWLMFVYACVSVYIHVTCGSCVHTCPCIYVSVSKHVRTCLVCACLCVHMCLCARVCTHVHVCVPNRLSTCTPVLVPVASAGLVVLKTGSDAFLRLLGLGVVPSFGLALSFHPSTVWGMLPPMVWTPGTPSE